MSTLLELRNVTSGPVTVFQQSTYQPDTTWRWMGSIAMDKQGKGARRLEAAFFRTDGAANYDSMSTEEAVVIVDRMLEQESRWDTDQQFQTLAGIGNGALGSVHVGADHGPGFEGRTRSPGPAARRDPPAAPSAGGR